MCKSVGGVTVERGLEAEQKLQRQCGIAVLQGQTEGAAREGTLLQEGALRT